MTKYVLSPSKLEMSQKEFDSFLLRSSASQSSKDRYVRDYNRYNREEFAKYRENKAGQLENVFEKDYNYRYKTIVKISGKTGEGERRQFHLALSFRELTKIDSSIKKMIREKLPNKGEWYDLSNMRITPIVTYDQSKKYEPISV